MRTDPECGYDLGAGMEIHLASPVSVFGRSHSEGPTGVGLTLRVDESRIEFVPIISVSGQGTPKGIVFAWLILSASSVGPRMGHPVPACEGAQSTEQGV